MNININYLPYLRYARFIVFLFIFLNLLWLNFLVYKSKIYESPQISVQTKETPVNNSEISEELFKEVSKIYETIREATASVKLLITPMPTDTASLATTDQSAKEFFVPLGSGTNSADEWTDVAGAQAYIDRSKYGSIKSVVFEASVYIPNGNQIIWVRLFNVTDKHPVWLSEMSHEGGAPKLLISQPITLDSGNKLYQAQMKNQLKDKTNLVQSRVRITTY